MVEPIYADVLAAAERVRGHVVRTPVLRHPELDRIVGFPVLCKAEPLQRTGSFKFRGATNAMRMLTEAGAVPPVVAYSSGNHGQAVAAAAAAVGARATIVMPADAPAIKRAATERWGAAIVTYDRASEDRELIARSIAERNGAALIPPYDDARVIAGQGTAALELFQDADITLDALLVCTGGGGLVAGSALAASGASPGTRVWAVEPEGSDDTARSLAAGERLANAPGGSPLCDSLLTPMPGALTFPINRRLLAGAVVVSDADVLAAMRFAFEHLKIVVEPGGAVALAALLSGRFRAHGPVGCVISGGNVDPAVFGRAFAPET